MDIPCNCLLAWHQSQSMDHPSKIKSECSRLLKQLFKGNLHAQSYFPIICITYRYLAFLGPKKILNTLKNLPYIFLNPLKNLNCIFLRNNLTCICDQWKNLRRTYRILGFLGLSLLFPRDSTWISLQSSITELWS